MTVTGSGSFLPGAAQPLGKSREVFTTYLGASGEMRVRLSVYSVRGSQTRCAFSAEAVALLNKTWDQLYRANPKAAFPSDIRLVFVPVQTKLNRMKYAWRFGGRASLEYWFPCDESRADESLAVAYLVTAHELTHAVISYRRAEAVAPDAVRQEEEIADGAMSCLYLLWSSARATELRSTPGVQAEFEYPAGRSNQVGDKDVLCSAWSRKMSELNLR
jgi:hypothetical protein